MEKHLETNASLEIVWLSLKETFLSFLKRKEIVAWTIIGPVLFSVFINIVMLLSDATVIEAPRQEILTIGAISFAVIILNSVIFADELLEDKDYKKLGIFFVLIGKLLAYLVYTVISVIFLLIFGFIMGSSFDLSLNMIVTSSFLLLMLIIGSWGIGLISSSIMRNNGQFVGIVTIIPFFTTAFFVLTAVRTNFFNRFPQVIIDLININPFTVIPTAIVQTIVGEGWIVIFNPLSGISLIFSSLLPIILFVVGLFLYNKFLVPKTQITTQEVETSVTVEKSESFIGMAKSGFIAAMFLPIQFLTEAVFILIILFLPFSIDIFLARMIVLFLSSILGILFIYLILIRLLRLNTVEHKPSPPLRSLKWAFIIFSVLWMSISLITITLNGISSIFDVKIPLFTSYDFLPVSSINNIFTVIFWFLSSTVILASFKEVWYHRTLIPLLEKRGISTSLSLLSTSFLYGLFNTLVQVGLEIRILQSELISIATVNDLGTTIFHSLHLFIFAFLLSLACGIIYVITRNILYSIFIHALTNLLILLTYLVPMLNNQILELVFSTTIIILIIGGLFIILNSIIHQIPSLPGKEDWIEVVPKFSPSQVSREFNGFFIICISFQIYLFFFQNVGLPGLIFILFNLPLLIILINNARTIFKAPKDNSGVQKVN